MARIQILPQERTLGEDLGLGLLGGLSAGLQSLAQQNVQHMLQQQQLQQTARGLEALGFDVGEAQALSGLPTGALQEIIKFQQKAPQEQAFAQALGQLTGVGIPSLGAQPGPQDIGQITDRPEAPRANIELPQAMPEPLAPRLTADQAFKLAQLGIKREEMLDKRNIELFKLTKDERKEIMSKARSARQNIEDLTRLEELSNEGKLDTPGYVEFLKRSGLDFPALMNPDSEEFIKIANNFMRDAKQYFGGRVSNYEIEQFLKTIPSLSQSPQGRQRVIANLKRFNRTAQEYYKAMRQVVNENRGVPPLDLQEKIEDRIDHKLQKISDQFRKDLAKKTPAAQSKLVAGLQAAAGSVIGAPGKLLGGIGGLLASLG